MNRLDIPMLFPEDDTARREAGRIAAALARHGYQAQLEENPYALMIVIHTDAPERAAKAIVRELQQRGV